MSATAPTQAAPTDGRGYVSLPTNADEAELMAKMGLMWLGKHAPDRLATDAAPVAELVEALRALVVLFGPVARDSTQKDWIEKAEAALSRAGRG